MTLNPNLAAAWHFAGWLALYRGFPDDAVKNINNAMRLSPVDPLLFIQYAALASAHLIAGRYDEATKAARASIALQTNFTPALRVLAASYARMGDMSEARKTCERVRQLAPGVRISDVRAVTPFRNEADFARYAEALKLAGFPD